MGSAFRFRGRVSLADVVRGWDAIDSMAPNRDEAERAVAAQFGYVAQTQPATKTSLAEEDGPVSPGAQEHRPLKGTAEPVSSPVAGASFSPIPFWRFETVEFFDDTPAPYDPDAEPLDLTALRSKGPPLPPRSLVRWSRLMPVLERNLATAVPGHRINVDRLVRDFGRGRPQRRLPKKPSVRWPTALRVVLDQSIRLAPLWDDQVEVARNLMHRCGRSSVRLHIVREAPKPGLVRALQPTEVCLVLSDLGVYGTEDERKAWQRAGRQVRHAGHAMRALVPAARSRWDAVGRLWGAARWACPTVGAATPEARAERVKTLLSLLSACVRIEIGLLRAVAQDVLHAGIDAELDAWADERLSVGPEGATWRGNKALEVRQDWASHTTEAVRQRFVEVLRKHHAGRLSDDLWEVESWILHDLGRELDEDLVSEAEVERAATFARRLAATQSGERTAIDPYAARMMGRLGIRAVHRDAAWVRVMAKALKDQPAALVGAGLGRGDLDPMAEGEPPLKWRMAQDGADLVFSWGGAFAPSGDVICELTSSPIVQLQFGGAEALQVDVRKQPRVGLDPEAAREKLNIRPQLETWKWAIAVGGDKFGIWADVEVKRVRFRMRWIPPSTFMMGSPWTEQGRDPSEGPQHQVRLAQGYWMAETQCTQALWEAVMGNNPSRFKSPERPVEQVSWEDAQQFIERVNLHIPELALSLPTEAEWENACRACTSTSTYTTELKIVGENDAPILDSIAWYGGNSGVSFELVNGHNSSDWPQKQYDHRLAGTHPVKQKAPNSWGLYDTLGNVWEWCQDFWCENYDFSDSENTPLVTGDDSAHRVSRGGSWSTHARRVRAACRTDFNPYLRRNDQGFRICRAPNSPLLRSGLTQRLRTKSLAPASVIGRFLGDVPTGRTDLSHMAAGYTENRAVLLTDRVQAELSLFEKPAWASGIGQDRFGLWAEVVVPREKTDYVGQPSVKFRLRWISPGRFSMGGTKREAEWGGWRETPRHLVTLTKGYWMGETPCTQALWTLVMGTNPSEFSDPFRPVERVSWKDAQEFMQAINERVPGIDFMLPTEAQWEYACRAGTDTHTYVGDFEVMKVSPAEVLEEIAWYRENAQNRTQEVMQKAPNKWGLYDMLGNVWEWCSDGYAEYSAAPIVDPRVNSWSMHRVRRGGSWSTNARLVRAAYRVRVDPSDRFSYLGFRICGY